MDVHEDNIRPVRSEMQGSGNWVVGNQSFCTFLIIIFNYYFFKKNL